MNDFWVVTTVGKQVEGGDYVFVRQEKIFTSQAKAEAAAVKVKQQFCDAEGKVILQTIQTSQGSAICRCDVGVFHVTIGDNDE